MSGITREMLLNKHEELSRHQEELLGQVNACNGALENIEYWLGVLEGSRDPSIPLGADAAPPSNGDGAASSWRAKTDEKGELKLILPTAQKHDEGKSILDYLSTDLAGDPTDAGLDLDTDPQSSVSETENQLKTNVIGTEPDPKKVN